MRELLKALKKELVNNLNFEGVREKSDIFITEHENVVPTQTVMPCVGIAAGEESREELAGSLMLYKRKIHVVAWMKLIRKDDDIVGDKGLLALGSKIDTMLDENLLGITGMEHAFCRTKGKPMVYGSGSDAVQQQILIIEYQQTGARP